MAGQEPGQGFGREEEIRLKSVQNLQKEAAAWGEQRHGRTRDLLAFSKSGRYRTHSKLHSDYAKGITQVTSEGFHVFSCRKSRFP